MKRGTASPSPSVLNSLVVVDVGSLSVRPLDPPASVETVLLVMPERSADSEIFELVVALNYALAADPQFSTQTPADI
jgi:hypothetical protein